MSARNTPYQPSELIDDFRRNHISAHFLAKYLPHQKTIEWTEDDYVTFCQLPVDLLKSVFYEINKSITLDEIIDMLNRIKKEQPDINFVELINEFDLSFYDRNIVIHNFSPDVATTDNETILSLEDRVMALETKFRKYLSQKVTNNEFDCISYCQEMNDALRRHSEKIITLTKQIEVLHHKFNLLNDYVKKDERKDKQKKNGFPSKKLKSGNEGSLSDDRSNGNNSYYSSKNNIGNLNDNASSIQSKKSSQSSSYQNNVSGSLKNSNYGSDGRVGSKMHDSNKDEVNKSGKSNHHAAEKDKSHNSEKEKSQEFERSKSRESDKEGSKGNENHKTNARDGKSSSKSNEYEGKDGIHKGKSSRESNSNAITNRIPHPDLHEFSDDSRSEVYQKSSIESNKKEYSYASYSKIDTSSDDTCHSSENLMSKESYYSEEYDQDLLSHKNGDDKGSQKSHSSHVKDDSGKSQHSNQSKTDRTANEANIRTAETADELNSPEKHTTLVEGSNPGENRIRRTHTSKTEVPAEGNSGDGKSSTFITPTPIDKLTSSTGPGYNSTPHTPQPIEPGRDSDSETDNSGYGSSHSKITGGVNSPGSARTTRNSSGPENDFHSYSDIVSVSSGHSPKDVKPMKNESPDHHSSPFMFQTPPGNGLSPLDPTEYSSPQTQNAVAVGQTASSRSKGSSPDDFDQDDDDTTSHSAESSQARDFNAIEPFAESIDESSSADNDHKGSNSSKSMRGEKRSGSSEFTSESVRFTSDKLGSSDTFEDTPLILAGFNANLLRLVESGDYERMSIILSQKPYLAVFRDASESSPLHWASDMGQYKIAELFISKGADVNAKNDSGATPLYIAAQAGHLDICQLYIDRGASVDAEDFNGFSPLHVAAQENRIDICGLLLEKGASVNIKDIYGKTPLHVASLRGNATIVQALLNYKADILVKSLGGYSSLHWAAQKGFKNVCDILIARGADLSSRSNSGDTPLHFASAAGFYDVCETLLKHGADPCVKNNDNTTAYMRAAENCHNDVCKLITKYVRER